MAKTKLKRMDRFELLEMIYNMRKANLDLTERLEAAEKRVKELEAEADQRVEDVRAEYVQRIDDLRMHGAAKELQKRLMEIEEQMMAFRRIMGKDSEGGEAAAESISQELAGMLAQSAQEAPAEPAAEEAAPPQESGGEAGESGE